MTAVLPGAIVVTLVRPLSWLLGLAGFLAGGGMLLMAAPVVVLPTPTGIQNALGAPLSTLVFGTPSTAMVLRDRGGRGRRSRAPARRPARGRLGRAPPDRAPAGRGRRRGPARDAPRSTGRPGPWRRHRAGAVLLPVIAVGIVAWQPVYDATYRELVLPIDLVTPLGCG